MKQFTLSIDFFEAGIKASIYPLSLVEEKMRQAREVADNYSDYKQEVYSNLEALEDAGTITDVDYANYECVDFEADRLDDIAELYETLYRQLRDIDETLGTITALQ